MKINKEIFDKFKKSEIPATREMQKHLIASIGKIETGKKDSQYGGTYHGYTWNEYMTLSRLPAKEQKEIFSYSIPLSLDGWLGIDSPAKSHFGELTFPNNDSEEFSLVLTTSKNLDKILDIADTNKIYYSKTTINHHLCDYEKNKGEEGIAIPVRWGKELKDREEWIEMRNFLFIPFDKKLFFVEKQRVSQFENKGTKEREDYNWYSISDTTENGLCYVQNHAYICSEHLHKLNEEIKIAKLPDSKIKYLNYSNPICLFDPKWVEKK